VFCVSTPLNFRSSEFESGSDSTRTMFEKDSLKRLIPLGEEVFSSVADPEPGSGIRCFFTLYPGSGSVMKRKSGSGKNIPDHTFERLERIFSLKILIL
jgi:hypothetical protein